MRSMFECRAVQNQLWDLTSGSLPEERQRALRSHLESCAACHEAYESICMVQAGIRATRERSLPSSQLGWHDLTSRIERREPAARPGLRMRSVTFGAGAAALCACAGLLFIHFKTSSLESAEPMRASAGLHRAIPGDPFRATSGDIALNSQDDEKTLSKSGIDDLQPGAGLVGPALRTAPPRAALVKSGKRAGLRLAANASASRGTSSTDDQNYPDGGTPHQNLRSDYVLQSASSGNDEDQNRRYVIDVVSTRTIASTEGAEDLHPW